MKKWIEHWGQVLRWSVFVVPGVLLAGCGTVRPISNCGYRAPANAPAGAPAGSGSVFAYRGELSEFDVLGVTRGTLTSDTEIERALAGAKRVRLHPGNSILLVQSGAVFPDGPMVRELSRHFRVVPFSGVPPSVRSPEDGPFARGDAENFSRSLRLAAARGGNDVILCYWGILESENSKLETRVISWVPLVNWIVPDEREHMRIRLKLALIDVRTGDWAVLGSEPVEAARLTVSPRRGVTDRKLVDTLKERAYTAGAKELLRQYSEIAAAK